MGYIVGGSSARTFKRGTIASIATGLRVTASSVYTGEVGSINVVIVGGVRRLVRGSTWLFLGCCATSALFLISQKGENSLGGSWGGRLCQEGPFGGIIRTR